VNFTLQDPVLNVSQAVFHVWIYLLNKPPSNIQIQCRRIISDPPLTGRCSVYIPPPPPVTRVIFKIYFSYPATVILNLYCVKFTNFMIT